MLSRVSEVGGDSFNIFSPPSPSYDLVILDLCSGSGNWSQPYLEAGYDVIRIDQPQDVRLVEHLGRDVRGVLCAPPCTVFSLAGVWVNRHPDEIKLALSVVDACLRLVVAHKPSWWALENPRGLLRRYLGKPVFCFDPCDFGDAWTKRTELWGSFMVPEKRRVVPTGSILSIPGMKSCSSKRERAKTPMGFARAFFEANP